ncbi:TlpA family protein disulfide reductase [Pectinatus cerevisiiphilus]|uniref:Peroxiredoxin n=1 Tax=Pectinatus cerevisiiphilus TaxID=86956 RepID=A0A4R3K8Z7_9FIRM|nr:TlpA disulfide reductase family protein [Pectinatus cerevisiiphilus]TCS79303.1 peroxiredoxin [Pectinatus cerevisiiphilus]
MNKKTGIVIFVASFVLLIVVASFAYNLLGKTAYMRDSVAVGDDNTLSRQGDVGTAKKMPAPDFTVVDSAGKQVKLSSLRGKPIVLNFWASWCPPCKKEMPEFDNVYKQEGKDVLFMMVDLVDGQRETQEKGSAYIKEQGFSFPVYFDIKREGMDKYGIAAIPSTFFIDRDGYIVTSAQGAIDASALRKGIEMIK